MVTAAFLAAGVVICIVGVVLSLHIAGMYAFSPIVDRGLVIFHVGGHDKGALTAYDMVTGSVRWTWAGDGPGYTIPVGTPTRRIDYLFHDRRFSAVAVRPSHRTVGQPLPHAPRAGAASRGRP